MGKESGLNVLLKVDSGAGFNVVAGQQSTSWDGSATPIDVSDKTTGGWGSTISGTRSVTLNVSGVATWPDTDGLKALMTAFEDGTTIPGRFIMNSDGNNYEGDFSVTSLNIAGGHDDSTSFSATLQNAGALVYAAAEA